ncbi:MAG: hypothetical protein JWO80_1821 [Bryobacterales bacterium]|nr:hypothetical protein [Bryobacterales bacterium]
MIVWLMLLSLMQVHRAEQDREISYWLLEPETHQFRISHDFNVSKAGQKSVQSFIRKGSTAANARFFDLDTGEELKAYAVEGAVQADLPRAIAVGESVRIRVLETYTDPAGYRVENGEFVWDRTLGRPRNQVTLPPGWMLSESTMPAIISLDREGRVVCRFANPRSDEIHVVLKGKKR